MGRIFAFITNLKQKLGGWFWLILVLLIILIVYLINSGKSSVQKYASATVSRGEIVEAVSTSGKVKADDYADLSFQSTGLVAWVGVKVGDKVAQGQAIAQLDTVSLNATYEEALNTYRDKEATVENILDEVKGHAGDETFAQKAERTTAEAARDSAYDAVLSAQRALQMATITAPFDGIVVQANPSFAGANVTALANSDYTIVNPDTIYFDAEVEETDLPNVQLDQEASIKLDAYPDETFAGTVENVGLVAFTSSTGGNAYHVRISMPPNEGLKFKVGMQGDVDITFHKIEDVLKVPATAVVSENDKNYVWVVAGGKAKKVEVTTGTSSLDETEIKSGLKEGDIIITEPNSQLKDGQKVTI